MEAIEELISIIEDILDEIDSSTNATVGIIKYRLEMLSRKL